MAIKIPNAAGIDTLRAAVPRAMAARALREPPRAKSFDVAGGTQGSLDFGGPHRVYVASIEDALKREMLKNARPAGWRYFVLRGETTVATAQVSEDNGERISFSNINFGALAESTARAIEVAQALADVKKRDYDLAVLEVPALYLAVLWLKSTGSNILVPLEPSPRGVEANRPYTQRELDSAAFVLAQQRMESHSRTVTGTAPAGGPHAKPRDTARRRTSTTINTAPPQPVKVSTKKRRPTSRKSGAKKK
jgi:hypothetical protein